MELKGKPVQVTDVKWAKVMVEVVVEEGVINGEVVGLPVGWLLDGLGPVTGPLRALGRGACGRLWVREVCVLIRSVNV